MAAGQSGGVCANDSDMAEGVQGEAKLYQMLIDGGGEVWKLLKEFVFDGKSNSVDSVFIWGLFFPGPFGSVTDPSSASLVSLSAAMSIL